MEVRVRMDEDGKSQHKWFFIINNSFVNGSKRVRKPKKLIFFAGSGFNLKNLNFDQDFNFKYDEHDFEYELASEYDPDLKFELDLKFKLDLNFKLVLSCKIRLNFCLKSHFSPKHNFKKSTELHQA